jgi:hypothetical protein
LPNTFLRPSVIARATVGLLYRELTVARTVWTDAINPGEFSGALNDTVSMRVPARRVARKRTLRAGTAIINDVSTEFSVPVKLDTDVYNGAPITDEELTLDITDFAAQVLSPQVRAVVEGIDDEVINEIENADYSGGMVIDPTNTDLVVSGQTDWYFAALRARTKLNEKHVPQEGRTLLIGTTVEEKIMRSDRFVRFDSRGPGASDALEGATIGQIAGFNVVLSTEIDPDDAYAYHRTAFVAATRAPLVPRGAAFAQVRGANVGMGASEFYNGLSVRWLMDYDYTNTTDRSLVNTWIGTAQVKDPVAPQNPASAMTNQRAVAIRGNS